MKKTDTPTYAIIQLENLDASQLPELKGWKESQINTVKENPFVKISDNKSWEEAKKARTNLVTARTTIEKQEKTIASKLRDFRSKVSKVSSELIEITLPHETKQQEEVKKYEAEKEAERLERESIEQERKQAIKEQIDAAYLSIKNDISNLHFSNIKEFENDLDKRIEDQSNSEMEEFDLDWADKVNLIRSQLGERVKYINEMEAQRIENDRLEKERKTLDAERKAMEAKRAEDEKKAREDAKKEADKLAIERKKIEEEKTEIESEKKRHADKLAKEKAEKEEADRKAKEEADRKRAQKRAESLKPDIEKLRNVIANIGIHMEAPEFKDQSAKTFYTNIKMDVEDLKSKLSDQLSNIN